MSPKLLSTICYFISLSEKASKKDLTNKKLQKLLYYSQAWNLVLNNKPLFKEEFQAWVHGPAIPTVYKKYKNFGSKIIDIEISQKDCSALSASEKKLLNEIWRVYGKYDASYLELLTHSEEPWQKARNGNMPYDASSTVISKQSMKEYYEQKSQKK